MRNGAFDVVILSDLLFNHSQVPRLFIFHWYNTILILYKHEALLRTCDETLTQTASACVLVFYTHHRPWLAEKDLEFFEKARNTGWECEQVVEIYTGVSATITSPFSRHDFQLLLQAMFANDKGDEQIRGMVHGWRMWKAAQAQP